MTPEQQADYDYAMSQIKPRPILKGIDFASIPMVSLSWDAERFQEVVKAGQEALRRWQDKIDAMVMASMGIPKTIYQGQDIFSSPNCRCTIIPQGSTTNAKDSP